MYKIQKDFAFSASHILRDLPEDHPCSRLHGHNYVVRLEFESEGLNDVGFVIDYRELDFFKRYIDTTFDHRHINDIPPFSLSRGDSPVNPSAENMAKHFYGVLSATDACVGLLYRVGVSETPKTWAYYS